MLLKLCASAALLTIAIPCLDAAASDLRVAIDTPKIVAAILCSTVMVVIAAGIWS